MGDLITEISTRTMKIIYQVSVKEENSGVRAWEYDIGIDKEREMMIKEITSKDEVVSVFWKEKYIKEAGVNWHKFYTRHQDKFFKDVSIPLSKTQ